MYDVNILLQQLIINGIITVDYKLSKKSFGILSTYPNIIQQILQHTSFIQGNLKDTLRERVYCIKNNITQQKTCIICSNPVTFRTTGTNVGYSDTCSYDCGIKNPNRIIKRVQTNVKRYGNPIPQQTLQVKEKQKNTNIDRYNRVHKNQKYTVPQSYTLLTNKEWLYEQHYINKRTLSDISIELNVDVSTVQRNLNKLGYDTKHFFVSTGEKEICAYLDTLCISYETNVRNIISPYELDVFIPQYNIAVVFIGIVNNKEKINTITKTNT